MNQTEYLKQNKDIAEKQLRAGIIGALVYAEIFGELPDNLTIDDLFLSSWNDKELEMEKLPPGLTVRGSVKMFDTKVRELPDDIKIGGGVLILRSHLERLPEDLKVPGLLELSYVPVKELPRGLSVAALHLRGCSELEKIADGIKILDYAYIHCCRRLKSLPEGLHCKRLGISNVGIRSLPNGLIVEEDLSISDCADFQEFPDNIEIGGSISISETGIHKLPKGLVVKGDLVIIDCPNLNALPDGLVVYGDTKIINTGIRTLPNNAIFGGDVILRGSSFESLPDGLVVSGNMDITGTDICKLPENMVVGGTLNILDLPITELPRSLRVYHNIISNHLSKPTANNLHVGVCKGEQFIVTGDGLVHVKARFISDGKGMIQEKDEKSARKERRKNRTYKYDYFAGKIPYVNVLSDGEHFVKCLNLRDGIFELAFRKRKLDSRGVGQYADITMDTVLPADEMTAMYRILTDDWRAKEKFATMEDMKEKYSVREFAELT